MRIEKGCAKLRQQKLLRATTDGKRALTRLQCPLSGSLPVFFVIRLWLIFLAQWILSHLIVIV
jgi:hypothetical protein